MVLIGKLIMYVGINSHGDVFHEMYTTWLRFPQITFRVVRLMVNQELLGPSSSSTIPELSGKSVLEEVDEKNHKVVYNVIEGDLVEELYKSFKIIFHVEPKDDGQLAIWTLEFEKMNASIPYPTVEILFGISFNHFPK
ncbi:Bet v I domain-containing protein [Cynara cardunculus var. scolymus]|uniref:Bet v I domain-containing protein n=1 Tax=Cynara cardunculus var. scolymus TaxID=59895 RepID=A0A103XVH8_CYNCS|nr:Bet v I domain-containing protein [Cynara cardunculus var. scolymus]